MSREINTQDAPAAIGPYVQAVDLGQLVLTSGQIPVDPKTGEVPAEIAAQTRQSLDNVKAIIEQAGLSVKISLRQLYSLKTSTTLRPLMQLTSNFSLNTRHLSLPVLV